MRRTIIRTIGYIYLTICNNIASHECDTEVNLISFRIAHIKKNETKNDDKVDQTMGCPRSVAYDGGGETKRYCSVSNSDSIIK